MGSLILNRFTYFVLIIFYCLAGCKNYVEFEEYPSIRIARDQWGVPHIMAPTDEEVAYGLAWAECEDDFVTMQEQMLAIKGNLGAVKGKDGIVADFALKFMGLKEAAEARYQNELSPKVIKILEHFVAGANAYAQTHKEELLSDELFPIQVEDVVTGYLLGLVEISGAAEDLKRIMDGSIVKFLKPDTPKGSNAIAINDNLSTDGQTYLAINSHQPLEGWYSWYEAHLISEEGQNILGGTFPGGATIFHGVNEHLGWAHTVNNADFSDVFKLKMHPDEKLTYLYDGDWKKLKKKQLWSWLKLWGPLKIPIRRIIYESEMGTTFKTDDGFYAWRFQAKESIQSVEQWYRMNRAENFEEFQKALKIRGIPCTNLVYADSENNIYYLSNGTFPKRSSGRDWSKVLDGESSINFYNGHGVEFDSLPQVLNPDCGFVFNTNNTPYSSTCNDFNPRPNSTQSVTSYMKPIAENNRSRRFLELICQYSEISYEDFKKVKFDKSYPTWMGSPKANNLERIFMLDESDYPEIADALRLLKRWDRNTNPENQEAFFFILCYKKLSDLLRNLEPIDYGYSVSDENYVGIITNVREELMATYGTLTIPLGQVQRHSRGDVDLPIFGGPDVLSAIYTKKQKDGRYRVTAGESYILLAQFNQEGLPELESVHSYGSSAKPHSPHYTDQMELFVNQELKPMTLSKEEVLAKAVSIYHPLKIVK